MKFSIKDFFSKNDQIHRKPRFWSHLMKKSFIANFIFCAVVWAWVIFVNTSLSIAFKTASILFAPAVMESKLLPTTYPTYTNERLILLNKIKSINCSILESSDAAVTKIILFGDNTLSNSSNTLILNSTIEYISTQWFEGSVSTLA